MLEDRGPKAQSRIDGPALTLSSSALAVGAAGIVAR
jgi:hypothetical protein